jgi:hypothetical protein
LSPVLPCHRVQFWQTENRWRLDRSYRGCRRRVIPRMVDAARFRSLIDEFRRHRERLVPNLLQTSVQGPQKRGVMAFTRPRTAGIPVSRRPCSKCLKSAFGTMRTFADRGAVSKTDQRKPIIFSIIGHVRHLGQSRRFYVRLRFGRNNCRNRGDYFYRPRPMNARQGCGRVRIAPKFPHNPL